MVMYIGNGAYCYANSTAMLLKHHGEHILPSTVEVLSGVGLGATLESNGMLFLNNCTVEPDTGISRAMDTLGFIYEERASEADSDCPLEELKNVVNTTPVMIGPVDMGYLKYLPLHKYLHGADHFVIAYKMDDQFIYVHDPAGFPHARLDLESFSKAWKAEAIPYRRGSYRWWHSPKRVATPTEEEITQDTIAFYQQLYYQTEAIGSKRGAKNGKAAFSHFRDYLHNQEVSGDMVSHLTNFLFQLGARRANDFSEFFSKNYPELSRLKRAQSELLGVCHCITVQKDWKELAARVVELSEIEEKFEEALRAI